MSLVDCSKVIVKNTESMGLGAFINQSVTEGTLIERGIARRVNTDGNQSPYLFTWSEDRSVWAFASGCATFYNTSLTPNTRMERNFENDSFEIYAIRDIEKGEQLTHKYKSLDWRECFQKLKTDLKKTHNN